MASPSAGSFKALTVSFAMWQGFRGYLVFIDNRSRKVRSYDEMDHGSGEIGRMV